MAIPGARVSASLRDSEASESVVTFYSLQTPGILLDDHAGTFETLLEGVSDSVVSQVEVTAQDVTPDATVPGGNVDNEIQAKFAFITEDGTTALFTVPGFDRALLIPGGSDVDVSAPPVAALLNFMLSASSTGPKVTDARGARLISLRWAVEAYSGRASRD